ncbi:MAG: phosphotransferase enzyme family protein [Paracoccaceae bacterium]
MAGLYDDEFLEQLRRGAESLLDGWGLSPETRLTLLNISENATFRADDPRAAAPVVVRVHRPGYHSPTEIASELAWIAALRAEGVVETPRPLEIRGGGHIAAFETADGPREVVAFEFVPGTEPSPDARLVDGFRDLGAITARLHAHARRWRRPEWFARKTWTFDAVIGREALWGDWRAGPGLTAEGAAVLTRAAEALETRLGAWGSGADRFGLIHADLRLANLLVEGGRIAVIDFDDCGFGWFGFDFAAAVSFIESDPRLPEMMAAWIAGYRTVAEISAEAQAMLPAFVLLRRMQLTAWIASHAETPTAAEMGPAYTEGTVEIAERYLAGRWLL